MTHPTLEELRTKRQHLLNRIDFNQGQMDGTGPKWFGAPNLTTMDFANDTERAVAQLHEVDRQIASLTTEDTRLDSTTRHQPDYRRGVIQWEGPQS